MSRSVRASEHGLVIARQALHQKGWTQDYLAGRADCSRLTVIKFLAGRPIDKRNFAAICAELSLEWGNIAELDTDNKSPSQTANLDALVREVRSKVSASIQKRCGTMRVLDMEQPITIDSIYTSVNILQKISRNQRRSIDELMEGGDRENFDRFVLGAVQQRRVPGLEAVGKHDKLLILGKPGAGKTTFLKSLALQCKEGQLHQDRVPFFVTLKDFAEADGQPTLIDFISRQLTECGIEDARLIAEQLLRGGRAIILLDGLDEVRWNDHDRVLNTIRHTSEQFDANQFIITCRIAAKEYTFEKFTEVEVADFDTEQIAHFARKWFDKDPIKAREFPQELKTYPGLQELATNPLLLTLLCLVFQERAGFPANRFELYKEGLDVLLKKWDAKRNIKRDEVYKQLSLQRKEDLLSQIAWITFEQSDYFFKKKFVEEQIQEYIRNLPNASSDPEALQLDSEAVLNSIAAQHGLLVERASGIYSFSHLTFLEYFTARQFKEKTDGDFSDLVRHITENKWREVFLLTVGMLKNADQLLQTMKQQVDEILAKDNKLQQFLIWVEQKSDSIKHSHKPAAVRCYYLTLDFANTHNFDLARTLDLNLNLNFNLALNLARVPAVDLVRSHAHTLDLAFALDLVFTRVLNLVCALHLVCTIDFVHMLDPVIDIACKINSINLQRSLEQINSQLPDSSAENRENFRQWWQDNGKAWSDQLRLIAIEYRNIGHDWQFTEEQEKLLQQYYDANKLLVDCLNNDCYVSREVRESIESTLLLPIASIEKYKQK